MKTFATNRLPRMNPCLEAYWSDIHSALTLYARDIIDSALPLGLQARVEEYLSVEGSVDDEDSRRRIVPVIGIYDVLANKTEKGAVLYRMKQDHLLNG